MLKPIQGPAKLPDPGCLLKPSFYHCIAVTSSGNSSAHRPSSADGGSVLILLGAVTILIKLL